MEKVSIVGLDIAKNRFHAHGAAADGNVVFRKALPRARVLAFLEGLERCIVVIEACASAHHCGREIMALRHEVRLIHPQYVKPYLKRQENDAADAEAIAEAASRPTMRFIAVKEAERQGQAMVLKTRDLLAGQRTQTINALRGHMAEHGLVAPKGTQHLPRLRVILTAAADVLPATVVALCELLLAQIDEFSRQIDALTAEIRKIAADDDVARRLLSIPGIGPISAVALATRAPPRESFSKGRDFSAWVGLVPLQHSTGGRTRLGRTSKMGQRDLRRLLIIGAMSVIGGREAWRRGGWFLARKDAGKEAQDAGRGCPSQQDGAHRLGTDGPWWPVQDTCGGLTAAAGWESGESERRVIDGKVEGDRIGRTRDVISGSDHAIPIWTLSSNSP